MSVFKEHKLKLSELFKVIPEEIFVGIAKSVNVDYYTKTAFPPRADNVANLRLSALN